MNVENAYDQWAESYDSMSNKTRDLDLIAAQRSLGHLKFKSILEIGCGTGKNTAWLVHQCDQLVAVDFSEEMMTIAKKKIADSKVEWKRFDISKPWPLPNGDFDLITFNLVLEHVNNLDAVFQQAAERLSPDGMIYVSELHPFKQYLGSKARFETEDGTREINVFTHHVSDFTQALSNAGLNLVTLNESFDKDRQDLPRLLTLVASLTTTIHGRVDVNSVA